MVVACPAGEGTNKPVVLTTGGQDSNSVSFSYSPPVLSGITASSFPTAGGTIITITGSGFGLNPEVSIGSQSATVQATGTTHSRILCTLPAGEGTSQLVQVTVAGQVSNSLSLDYDPPALTSISPSTGPTSGGTLLTLTGSNFGLTQTVRIGERIATASGPQQHGRLVVSLPEGGGAGLPVSVQVGARSSNLLTFAYLPPAITTVSPSTGPMSGGTLITIQGTNFGPNGSVSIGGKSVSQYLSRNHQTLVCTLPPGSGANRPVIVTCVDQTSEPASFSYLTEDFADWAASIPWSGLDSSPGADPRRNGWKNCLAYAFGVNPLTSTGGEIASREPRVHGMPALSRDALGRMRLSFWHRRAEAHPDLSSVVLFAAGSLSEDAWQPGTLAPQIEVVDDIWEFRTYTDDSAGPGRRFGRVRVQLQQP